MIYNSLAVAAHKGGVGKTSIVANLAASVALGEYRVLAVDLDAQGNLSRDLGYRDASDEGRGLFQAVMGAGTLAPLRDVRPGLDVIPGGADTKRLADLLALQMGQRTGSQYNLEGVLAPLAADYDLVIIDMPGSASANLTAGLALSHFVVIPTKIDDGSMDGLEGLAAEIGQIRDAVSPQLWVLGVVLFDVGSGDTALRNQARTELEELLGDVAPVLQSSIRHSRRGAVDMRRLGQVAYEYEQAYALAKPWYQDRSAPRPSAAAAGLAGDYQQLTEEVMRLMFDRLEAEAPEEIERLALARAQAAATEA